MMSNSEMPVTMLLADRNHFLCNFGCPVQSHSMKTILKHYLEAHTREDLANWSLSYDWIYRIYRFAKDWLMDLLKLNISV